LDKKMLNRIFLLTAGGVLLALGVIGALRAMRPDVQTGPVLLEQVQPDRVTIDTAEATPAPTLEPESYQNTVTLLVDRVPLFTLESEFAVKQTLWEYLTSLAIAPDGERFLSAAFDCELIVAQADPYVKPLSTADALAMLEGNPALVPVRVTTLKVDRSETSPQVTQTNEPALPKGARIITQLGAGALNETTVETIYRAGQVFSSGAPITNTLREARATMLRVGTYAKGMSSGSPTRLEGPEGKSKGDLKLAYPMRGQVTNYFGFVDGKMNYGLNMVASAGSKITAPGEGVVVYCGERGAYGFVVDIDHGNGFLSRLTHLSDVQVEMNQRVFQGDAIGVLTAGENESKSPFHFELIIDGIPYNPLYYID
jgi:murein DD-endopeptidase MepM/ murein hydrolase activator NlpD